MSITISNGTLPLSGCVNVTGMDDDLLEGSEGFDVSITGTDLLQVTVGMQDRTAVTISDSDGMHTFESSVIFILPMNICFM